MLIINVHFDPSKTPIGSILNQIQQVHGISQENLLGMIPAGPETVTCESFAVRSSNGNGEKEGIPVPLYTSYYMFFRTEAKEKIVVPDAKFRI